MTFVVTNAHSSWHESILMNETWHEIFAEWIFTEPLWFSVSNPPIRLFNSLGTKLFQPPQRWLNLRINKEF